MNFSSPTKVTDTIRASDQTEQIRANNRVKIQNAANGLPPLTTEQQKKMRIKINVNWGELSVLVAHGRRQYDTAFLGTQNFFKVTIPLAPEHKKRGWGIFITNAINRIMKRDEEYSAMKEDQHASLVLHGIAPSIWERNDMWRRRSVAIEDFRVATDTKTSFGNLSWIAVRVLYTEGELSRKVFGKYSDPGWKKSEIKKILHEYHDTNYETTNYDWINAPEKMAELVKQNAGFYSSDAVPTIPLWHFYYMDDDNPMKPNIQLCVVPDLGVRGTYQDKEFLYKSRKPICNRWGELISCQFGDLNNKSPFLYHSVRSLGFLLMEPCFWTNIFRCRLLQHGMESMNAWMRIADPDGKARAQKVDLFDTSVVPEGVSIVPSTERHQIDGQLVGSILAQLKQLQSEAAQSYTQSTDSGTQKEQTAFETRVKVAAVNAMMTGLLGRAFRKETFAYRETCRRFCLSKSTDPEVQEFQQLCKEEGIPRRWVNVEYWDVEPEVPMGSGNPTMAQAQVDMLMQARNMFDPQAQEEILHEFAEVVTNDPRKAERWVPLDNQRDVSDAQQASEFAFATLMNGVPVKLKRGLNVIEQIETLLGLMSGVIAQLEKNGNMADGKSILGLQTVGQHVNTLIQQLAQDPSQKERARQYEDGLNQMGNALKGFMQRLQEKEQAQGDPEAMAKAKTLMMMTEGKMKAEQATTAQTLQIRQLEFQADQQRKDAELAADLERGKLETDADIANRKKQADAAAEAAKKKAATNGGEEA